MERLFLLTIDLGAFMRELDDDPFEEYPVDIKTFVLSPNFLDQPGLSDIQYDLVEAMSQIYRLEDLKRFMPEKDAIRHYDKYTKAEVILQCGKGSGKDYTSTVGTAYLVYKLLCLKNPARYFGKPHGDAIDIINIAINAQQAKNVFFKGFRSKIEHSPWFAGKYHTKMDSIEFDKEVTVYSGHSERESHEGLNLIMAVLDEISGFAMESASGNENAKTGDAIYNAFRASVDSRFPDYGKVVLLSFPRFKGDFISTRYEEVIAEKDILVREHTYVINPELPSDDPNNTFDIEWEEDHILSYKYPGVFALKRPTWDVNPTRTIDDFKLAFFNNPADALQRFACMPGTATDAFFKSKEKIDQMLVSRNPLDQFRRWDATFEPKKDVVYYAHADLAIKHDKCEVAIAHVEKWVEAQYFMEYQQMVPLVIVDAIAWWEPRKEGPVDLSEVKQWIVNARNIHGINIGLVTFDRWNSFDIQRDLQDMSIKTDTLSVAKKHYEDLSMLVYEGRIVAPRIEILRDELLELRIIKDNKVDHPRKKSKDLADALCGAVYNAVAYTPRARDLEVEVHTWDRTALDKQRLDAVESKPKMTPEIEEYLGQFYLL